MKRLLLYLFAIVFVLVLAADLFNTPLLYQITKPLIIPSLLAIYWVGAEERSPLLLLALLFSWVGDVLLMFSGELYFMLGLGGFLVSHLFYIATYRQHKSETGEGFHGVQKARYAFPIILGVSGLLTILYPSLDGMKIPVTVYALVLMVMTLMALFRYGFTSMQSFWLVFGGAFLFMISDSTLAINKFLQPVAYSGFVVMSTYMAAQFLIVQGLMKHK